MSSLAQAMVVNAAVLIAVLEADIGRHRNIGWFRVIRPRLLAGLIVPIYLTTMATQGAPLTLEVVGVGAGLLVGLVATSLMGVYRSPETARPTSRAGIGYASVWIVVIGARAAFSFGSYHWFGPSLATWMTRHQVSADAITNALVLMAITTVLTRTVAMAIRAARLPLPFRVAVTA